MRTKLIWITPHSEKLIAYIARVSNPQNQTNPSSTSLLRYLIKNSHWSPFEMVNMCIEINTSRSISTQILRHRSFSFQEFSQRYADVNLLSEPETINLRRQDIKNRQNSIDDIPEDLKEKYTMEIQSLFEKSNDLYCRMINDGIAKECARAILPLNTPTRLYMNGSLRSWIHYLQLRSKNGTQKEHADIAVEIIQNIIKTELPVIYEVCFSQETKVS